MNRVQVIKKAYTKRRKFFLYLLIVLELSQIARVTLLIRKRAAGDFSAVDATASISIVLMLISIAVLFIVPLCRQTISRTISSRMKYLIYYYLYCGVTVAWSSSLLFGVFRTVEMLTHILLASAIIQLAKDRDHALRIIVLIAIASVAFAILGYMQFGMSITGVLHSNAYPAAAGMALTAVIGVLWVNKGDIRIEYIFYFIILLYFVLKGTSSSTNVSVLVGIVLLLSSGKKGRISWGKILFLSVFMWLSFEFIMGIAFEYIFPDKTMAQVETLHGRTGMWKTYWEGVMVKPIFGWGFPSGEKEAHLFGHVVTSSSHNSVISILINTGFVGLLIFLISMLKIVGLGLMRVNQGVKYSFVIFVSILVGLINSMSYPLIGSHWFWPASILLLFLSFFSIYVLPVKQKLLARNHLLYRNTRIRVDHR